MSKYGASKNIDLMPLIPHPPTYFSCPGLAWDALDSGREALGIFLGTSKAGEKPDNAQLSQYAAPLIACIRNKLMDDWGLKSRLYNNPTPGDNPLLSLWQSRFLETIRHIWVTGYSYKVSPEILNIESPIPKTQPLDRTSRNKNIEDLPRNKSIAISTSVSKWRDSIRDYTANFYAFACPTASSLKMILDQLDLKPKHTDAVEAGAGTGYWSAIINSYGSKNNAVSLVRPYDIAPPSKSLANTYHGMIRTFTDVDFGDGGNVSQMNSVYHSVSTLLLCYPPPEHYMASMSVEAHIENGGQKLIHIGEWQGLTGDAAFEEVVTQNFYCEKSDLLPLWGTDATYLTVWKRKGQHHKSEADVFSPAFGYCSAQPCPNSAVRRCRYARCLQYCSQSCFTEHEASRRAYLALHMVELPVNKDMEFNCEKHFAMINIEEVQDRKKKRRMN
jgi:protein-L-isoaspartate O-methyltransferase